MSSPNRRDSSRALRAIPKTPHFDGAATQLDPRPPRFFDDEPRRNEIPSFVTPVRSASRKPTDGRSAAPARGPAPSTTPPNVIPFTKPRAIAAIAASNPGAVMTMTPAPASAPTKAMTSPPPHSAPPMHLDSSWSPAGASSSSSVPADRLATGWTPPHAVKAIAQPASPRAPSIATAWPAANTAAPVHAAAQPAQYAHAHAHAAPVAAARHAAPVHAAPLHSAPAPAFAPSAPAFAAPVHAAPPPVVTTRPASQMSIAVPAAVPAAASGAPAEPQAKWTEYDQLGLGQPKLKLPKLKLPKLSSQQTAKLIVNAYKLLGFGILTIIVIVLVGYIASSAFYYFSESWIVPMAISPTDEKVVSLQSQLAEQQTARDRIADDLQQAERTIVAQQTFQAEFAKAIRSDLEGRKLALSRIRELATAAARTRTAIKNQNAAYANASRQRMAQEYAAGLIDRTAMLSGKYQLAQITSSNLTLAERQAEFETRAAELEAQTRSLDAILNNAQGSGNAALSYEVLRIKQEYEASRLDLAKSTESLTTLKAALARQDKIVSALQQSAYLRAARDGSQVAFVPYDNLSNVSKGASLYGCKLGMIFCYHVGEVLEVLPGEVQFKHPHRDRNLRGQLVVLKLDKDDAAAAADDVLFAGGRPILF
jgi:hypothetical protein